MSALTSLLSRDQIVPHLQIEAALQRQVIAGGDVQTALLEVDAIREDSLASYLGALEGIAPATRDELTPPPPQPAAAMLSEELAIEFGMVPIRHDAGCLVAAIGEGLDGDSIARIEARLKRRLILRMACKVRIAACLERLYGAPISPRLQQLTARLDERDPGRVMSVSLGRHRSRPSQRPTAVAPPPVGQGPTAAPTAPTSAPAPVPAATYSEAMALLKAAPSADAIVAQVLAFSLQFLDRAALFVIIDSQVVGYDATGTGMDSDSVRQLAFAEQSAGLLADSARSGAVRDLVPPGQSFDRHLMRRIGFGRSQYALAVPIHLGTEPVLLLVGDAGGRVIGSSETPELVTLCFQAGASLERLLRDKRRQGGSFMDFPASAGRLAPLGIKVDAIPEPIAEPSESDELSSGTEYSAPELIIDELAGEDQDIAEVLGHRPLQPARKVPAAPGERPAVRVAPVSAYSSVGPRKDPRSEEGGTSVIEERVAIPVSLRPPGTPRSVRPPNKDD